MSAPPAKSTAHSPSAVLSHNIDASARTTRIHSAAHRIEDVRDRLRDPAAARDILKLESKADESDFQNRVLNPSAEVPEQGRASIRRRSR
jgi:hypothetical protein